MIEGLGFGRRNLIKKIVEQNWDVKTADEKKFNYNELLFVIQELLDEEGKPYHENRRVGLHGHHIFREFVKYLLYRNVANYDSMILITADKGAGKSSAAIMIARAWCRLLGIRFDPKRHIAYNNADVMNKIDKLNKFEPIIADEAIRFACVVGNTEIKLKNNDVKIKDLVNKENFEVYTYNIKTKKKEIQIAKKCLYMGEKEVYELELENGKKIQTSKEHKFLTMNGWKKLEELSVGDDLVDV